MINHILKIMQKFQVDVNDTIELYKTVWKTGMLKKNVPNIRKTKKSCPAWITYDVFKTNHIVPNDTFDLLSLNT